MDRVGNQVLDILCGILTKNINFSHLGFVTFTHVDVAPDLRTAKVYYSVLGRKSLIKRLILLLTKKEKRSKNLWGLNSI